MHKVYDKNGRELTIGTPVRHATDGRTGKVAAFYIQKKKVRVTWESQSLLGAIGAPLSILGGRRIGSLSATPSSPHLRALDLVRIDSPTETEVPDAS
jgi:hypothetical protein